MGILFMVLQLLMAIFIIAGLHEWGHMLAARMFGIRVEQFSIGFPPILFRFRTKATEYVVGAIPLGGYVKLSGMMDESLDKEKLKEPAKPYEFRSKPAWQRLIVMIGGIVMNIITALLVFMVLTYVRGEQYLSYEELNKHGIEALSLGKEVGFRTSDKILALNGLPYARFSDLYSPDVLLQDSTYYTVSRGAEEVRVLLPSNFLDLFSDPEAASNFLIPRRPYSVVGIMDGMPASEAGIREGDRLISLAGKSVYYMDQLKATLKEFAYQDSVPLVFTRGGEEQQVWVHLHAGDTLGITQTSALQFSQKSHNLWQSFLLGSERVVSLTVLNVKGISKIFSGKVSASKSLSGPIGIAKMFGDEVVWGRFWTLVALISVFVALFNLLPIPALDGGHVLLCLVEMVSGKTLPSTLLYRMQVVGMVLLLTLTALIIFNDLLKIFY